jgi:lipopolysaccharide export system permease protein
MFFVYYGLFSLGVSLGETGGLSPGIGVWAPNLLFLGLSAGLVRMAVQERGGWFLRWVTGVAALCRRVVGK